MGEIISGKTIATAYKEDIKNHIETLVAMGKRRPSLTSILVGNDGGSMSYIRGQRKVSEQLGIKYDLAVLEEDSGEEALIELIKSLNNDDRVDGIMLQLPLPSGYDEEKIIDLINPLKDIDGLTSVNLGRFYKGVKAFIPCTARSVMELLKSVCSIKGKDAVVIGRSNIVGKPVSTLLTSASATVTVCHSQTKDLKGICSKADIIVSAVGKPGFITSDYVKNGAVVIDVGTTMVEGKVKGDVDFDGVIEKASFVSPVPGGVGAMTTTMMMKNLYDAWVENVQ